MKYLVIWVLVFMNTDLGLTSLCYWNSGCPYKWFSSRTPYDIIRGDIRDSAISLKGCEPVSVWGMIRHGKRSPGPGFAQHMKRALVIKDYILSSYEAKKCSLCAQDVENLKNWVENPETLRQAYSLTNEGYNEMKQIGKRLKQAFPKLLQGLEEGNYTVRPVLGKWLENSAEAFIEGFENKKMSWTMPIIDNDNIAPYETCKKFERDVRHNPNTYDEAVKYQHTPEYLVTKDRINRRSGIDYVLTDDNITALYDLCRYDSSAFGNKFSPWCALFTSEDLKVLEYIGDLRQYYRNGYGNLLSEKFGRLPLTDLLKTFKQVKEGKGKKLTAYITHSTIIDMTFTALGLFKDEIPLTGECRNPARKWRSSKMSTFSSNLIAVLYRCPKNELDEFNVVFYHNEEPLMTICKSGVCAWEEFEEKNTFHDISLDFCDT